MTPDHVRETNTQLSTVTVVVAIFATAPAVRNAENQLGQLAAEGQIELLDGILLDWPASAARPDWRELRNLPRIAALPEPFWTAGIDDTHPAPDPSAVALRAALAVMRSGTTAIAAVHEPNYGNAINASLRHAGALALAHTPLVK